MRIYRLSELKLAHQEFIIYSREPREASKREKWRKAWRRMRRKEGRKKEHGEWWQEEGGKEMKVKEKRERESSFISAKFSWRIMARIQCTDANSRSCAECGAPFDYLDCTWAPPEFVSKETKEERRGGARMDSHQARRGRERRTTGGEVNARMLDLRRKWMERKRERKRGKKDDEWQPRARWTDQAYGARLIITFMTGHLAGAES